MDGSRQPRMNTIHIVRGQLGDHHQLVIIRNNIHEAVSWFDYTTHRMRGQVHYRTGHRSSYYQPCVGIPHCTQPFRQGGQFSINVSQL